MGIGLVPIVSSGTNNRLSGEAGQPQLVSQEILYACGHWNPTLSQSSPDMNAWPEKILCPVCRTYVKWKVVQFGADGRPSRVAGALSPLLGDAEQGIENTTSD